MVEQDVLEHRAGQELCRPHSQRGNELHECGVGRSKHCQGARLAGGVVQPGLNERSNQDGEPCVRGCGCEEVVGKHHLCVVGAFLGHFCLHPRLCHAVHHSRGHEHTADVVHNAVAGADISLQHRNAIDRDPFLADPHRQLAAEKVRELLAVEEVGALDRPFDHVVQQDVCEHGAGQELRRLNPELCEEANEGRVGRRKHRVRVGALGRLRQSRFVERHGEDGEPLVRLRKLVERRHAVVPAGAAIFALSLSVAHAHVLIVLHHVASRLPITIVSTGIGSPLSRIIVTTTIVSAVIVVAVAAVVVIVTFFA
mmetsp:Transcript_25743/g.61308  ORF Transcript_25743/g.61308 Transcript_25743/m.61308 type:complete len:311 (+) Transcript_25743:1563-2495(+)